MFRVLHEMRSTAAYHWLVVEQPVELATNVLRAEDDLGIEFNLLGGDSFEDLPDAKLPTPHHVGDDNIAADGENVRLVATNCAREVNGTQMLDQHGKNPFLVQENFIFLNLSNLCSAAK